MWHPLSNTEFLPKNKHDYKQLQIYLEGKKINGQIFKFTYKKDRLKRISYKLGKSGEKRPSMYKIVT